MPNDPRLAGQVAPTPPVSVVVPGNTTYPDNSQKPPGVSNQWNIGLISPENIVYIRQNFVEFNIIHVIRPDTAPLMYNTLLFQISNYRGIVPMSLKTYVLEVPAKGDIYSVRYNRLIPFKTPHYETVWIARYMDGNLQYFLWAVI